MRVFAFFILVAVPACAQEADSGFELRTTLSAVSSYSQELSLPPRDGSDVTGGFRAMLYPTWKLNSHWTISGAFQFQSRPYFEEDFSTQGYGVKGDLMQLNLGYARFCLRAAFRPRFAFSRIAERC